MWQFLDQHDRAFMGRMQHLPYLRIWRGSARWFSLSGDGGGYALVIVLLTCSGGERGLELLRFALLAFAIELPLYWLLKNSLKRARPCHALANVASIVQPHDKFSLPSGHCAAAFVFASVLSWYWPPLTPLAYGWAAAVGFSRVVLGVHYLGDVLVGALLGGGAAWLSFYLLG
ncbi:phosphatase PAP2 family protein [uncultured Ferrimonas sp.]|uniref:phosphatase PAP2 family protein n=1 Tax=uncultured Ferrimonas sp. TaxID=432640 RepID=UPI002607A7E1|nr:phosphatase PAP2 family protein [uncultured Ferrimonas sp.]